MTALIQTKGIQLDVEANSATEVVEFCGKLLVELGAVSREYVDAMLEREQKFSSAIGLGVAIPHGTAEARSFVFLDQLVFVRLATEISWGAESVRGVLAIASRGDSHVGLLGAFASLMLDESARETLLNSGSKGDIVDLFQFYGRE